MKKIIKSLLIVFVICLLVCACRKDEPVPPIDPVPKVTPEEEIINNISSEDLGLVTGNYGNRYVLIKITNKNDKDLYLDVRLTYYNNGDQADLDDDYIYVGANKSVYAVSKMFAEDPIFTSYKHEVSLIKEVSGYSDIINNIKISHKKNNDSISVTMTNDGTRVTTSKALLLFYSGNKIVDVAESIQYDLMPTSTRSEEVKLPHKTSKTLIPFDRVEVFVNEVGLKL